MSLNIGINQFPDELVSNETKNPSSLPRNISRAIWGNWSGRYIDKCDMHDTIEAYARGEHSIERIEGNITNNGKLIKKEFLRYDRKDRVKILPQMLREFYNSVDMSQFVPVVRAIDPSAMEIKQERKNEKMKLFLAKDFIQEAAALNGGQSPIPLDQIPQSKEQIQLEEETAKPLRVERGELKALDFITMMNDFNIQQKQFIQDVVKHNLMAAKVETDPNEGIKIERIPPRDFIAGKGNDMFFRDSPYFGMVKEITVGMFKNIAAESGLKFADKEIKKRQDFLKSINLGRVIK